MNGNKREKKIKEPKVNKRTGLRKKNLSWKQRSMMSKMSKGMVRKMRRHATGRTAVGKLITKGARALKSAVEGGLHGMYERYGQRRREKLRAKIQAEPQGMGRKKKRLIKRKNRWS